MILKHIHMSHNVLLKCKIFEISEYTLNIHCNVLDGNSEFCSPEILNDERSLKRSMQ